MSSFATTVDSRKKLLRMVSSLLSLFHPGAPVDKLSKIDTPRIILIRPTKDIVRNKKEQQKKRRFCPKCFEVKLAQKIRINIAMTSVSGWTFKSPRNRRPRRTLVIPSDPSEVICFNCKLRHKQLCITFPTSLFTIPYFFVRSFR